MSFRLTRRIPNRLLDRSVSMSTSQNSSNHRLHPSTSTRFPKFRKRDRCTYATTTTTTTTGGFPVSAIHTNRAHGMEPRMRPLQPWLARPLHNNNDNDNKKPIVDKYKAIHLFRCLDQLGVVASISDLISKHGGNLLTCDLFVDGDNHPAIFFSRTVFTYDPDTWDREDLYTEFQQLHAHHKALYSQVHVPKLQVKPRVGILCSSLTHCVVELLHRYESNELPDCEIAACVSNHNLLQDSSLLRHLLDRHGIPFHYIPATTCDRREGQVLEAVQDTTDVLVLARYMQILSPDFLSSYSKDILNIHHGLLPSFKGANPYRQAYESGVKMIGATAHFVTSELDEGPIIEQLVERVSHRDTVQAFQSRTRALERQCLNNAVSYYLDHRIVRYSHDRCAIMN